MLTIKQASEIADTLSHAFSDVLVRAASEPVSVVARAHTRMDMQRRSVKCDCSRHPLRRSRNVTVAMAVEKGTGARYLTSPTNSCPSLPYEYVDCCSNCEKVFEAKEAFDWRPRRFEIESEEDL